MSEMQKWNAEKGEYEPYSVPKGWYCPLFCADMQRVVNCASCGKEIEYGDGYISQEIHNSFGLGYTVCPECHREEMERRMERAKAKGEVRGMRLIDADKLKETFAVPSYEAFGVTTICSIIDDAPTVDAEPVRQWKNEIVKLESEE